MRKITALLIALALALVLMCAPALAAGVNNITHDFEDFTLTFPEDEYLEEAEKTESAAYFLIYSTATSSENFTNNLNCIWSSDVRSVADVDPQELLDYTVTSIGEQLESMGFKIDNLTGDSAERIKLDGRDAIVLTYSYGCDANGVHLDFKNRTLIVSGPDTGSYTFSITAANDVGMDELTTILYSLKWK